MSTVLHFASKARNQHARHLRVLVHGYLSAADMRDRTRLLEKVPEPGADEDVLFLFWDSGSMQEVLVDTLKGAALGFRRGKLGMALTAAHAVKSGVDHFNRKKRHTRSIGEQFFAELSRFAGAYPQLEQVSLYGHSLGARILIEALLNAQLPADIRISNLVLMGGARELREAELQQILPLIRERIYNFYSRSDRVLQARPSLEKWIGRHPLPEHLAPDKLINTQLDIGHSDYWELLEGIFARVNNPHMDSDLLLQMAHFGKEDDHGLKKIPGRIRQLARRKPADD